jgi:HAE1 family hydrophobic/amphiphilic exporter-1
MKFPTIIYHFIAHLWLVLFGGLLAVQAQPVNIETVGFSLNDTRALTLREAVEMALAKNNDIELARQQAQLVQFDLQAARGSYDTRLLLNANTDRQRAPGTNIFNSGANSLSILTRNQTNGVQLEQALPFGGTRLSGEFASTRTVTKDPFNTFRVSNQTALTFSLTQPLARGRRFDEARRNIEIAKRNLTLSDQQFRQRVIETVASVQRAYWDLAFALKHLQVQQDTLRDTQAQHEHIRRLIEEGRLAPVEAIAVEAQIACFDKDRYDAVAMVARAQNELKKLLASDEREPLWQQALLPMDDVNLAVSVLPLPEALQAALQHRVELEQGRTAQSLNEIQQRFLREQMKPQIDLTASYSLNGFAGSSAAVAPIFGEATPPPRLLTGGYGQSLNNLLHNRFNTFRVGVTIQLPLRNTTAKAELARALAEAEKLQIEQRQLAQSIHVEVRNAWQELRTAEAKVNAAEAARAAAAKSWESERRKLDAGHATASVNLLLERQKQLAQAQGDALQARVELNKAMFELRRAMGVTLEKLGIELQR